MHSLPFLSLLLAVAVLPFALGMVPIVRFTSERIDVHVYPEEIVMEGSYVYRNPFPFPVAQGFTIPCPVDEDHPEPLEVTVEGPGGKAIPVRRVRGKTGFEAGFAARDDAEIRVSYRQKAAGGTGTYILTTTRPWGLPLERGVYVLHPHGTIILSSNYEPDLPGGDPGFERTGFLPEQDWHFTWRREHEEN